MSLGLSTGRIATGGESSGGSTSGTLSDNALDWKAKEGYDGWTGLLGVGAVVSAVMFGPVVAAVCAVIVFLLILVLEHAVVFRPKGFIQVFVPMGNGRTLTFQFPSLAVSIATMKHAIFRRTGILPDDQWLLFGAKPLADDKSFADYGIHNGATLQFNVQMRGGGELLDAAEKGDLKTVMRLVVRTLIDLCTPIYADIHAMYFLLFLVVVVVVCCCCCCCCC